MTAPMTIAIKKKSLHIQCRGTKPYFYGDILVQKSPHISKIPLNNTHTMYGYKTTHAQRYSCTKVSGHKQQPIAHCNIK